MALDLRTAGHEDHDYPVPKLIARVRFLSPALFSYQRLRRRQALWATSPVQTLPGGAVGRRLMRQYERHAELAAIIRFGVLHQSGRLGNSCRT